MAERCSLAATSVVGGAARRMGTRAHLTAGAPALAAAWTPGSLALRADLAAEGGAVELWLGVADAVLFAGNVQDAAHSNLADGAEHERLQLFEGVDNHVAGYRLERHELDGDHLGARVEVDAVAGCFHGLELGQAEGGEKVVRA